MTSDFDSGSRAGSPLGPAPFDADNRLENGAVFVQFFWRGDRFGHVIGLTGESIVHSLEGSSSEDWPPSPPLQQLSIEVGPDGARRAFLVGMAGKSHWSLVVEPIAGGFLFDAAVRCKEYPEFRGSCYSRLAPCPDLVVTLERLDFNPRESMAPLDHPHHGPSLLRADATCGTEPWFVVGPGSEINALPATFQWRYRATTTATTTASTTQEPA